MAVHAKTKYMRRAYSYHDEPGFEWNERAEVVRVLPGSQSHAYGVEPGWKVVEINGDPVRRKGDNQQTLLHDRIAERLRLSCASNSKYTVTFLFPLPDVNERLIQEQENVLAVLDTIDDEDRVKNLAILDTLNDLERSILLERSKACQGLLKSGYDELSVLFGERSAANIQQNHAVWKALRDGGALDDKALRALDFEYTTKDGDTPLHMPSTSYAAGPVLTAAARRESKLLTKPNKRGERPLETLLKRSGAEDRSKILRMIHKLAPEALDYELSDGRPLRLALGSEEKQLVKELRQNKISWNDVSKVLEAESFDALQTGYVHLARRVCAASPAIDMDDSDAIWSYLVCDNCFGHLFKNKDDMLEHNSVTRDRLVIVWRALKVLLTSSADETFDPTADVFIKHESYRKSGAVQHSSLKHIAKGLLAATKGPKCEGFDPREPYRKELVGLVNQLQAKTGRRLDHILKICQKENRAAAKGVANDIPFNELHDLLPTGAPVREVPERLRLDAKLVDGVQDVDPVPTPDWVLSQQMDLEVVNTLKDAGCIQKARDLVDLVSSKSNAISPERLHFSYLHSAWVWAFIGKHLDKATKIIEHQLGLNASTFPCKGPGDFTVLSFRARSEPKGISRILEKTGEAIEEEVALGTSGTILSMQPDLTIDAEDRTGEQLALLELLTPGCYVCDILGAEVSVDSFSDLMALYKYLRSLTLSKHGCQVVRTKNGFSRDAPVGAGGYRDLKLWLLIASEGFTVTYELQVHIYDIYAQKKFMHLCYECSRGSFDHLHLAGTWHDFDPPPQSCCAALCTALACRNPRHSAKVAPAPPSSAFPLEKR